MIEKAQTLELESVSDLIRMIISMTQNRGGYIYFTKKNGKYYFLVTNLVPSWYNLKGLPITVYAEVKDIPNGNFVAYSTSNVESEKWEYVNCVTDTSRVHIPIIRVKDLPDFVF